MEKFKTHYYSSGKTKEGKLNLYPVFKEEQLAHEKRLQEIKNKPSKYFQAIYTSKPKKAELPKKAIRANKVAIGGSLLKNDSRVMQSRTKNAIRSHKALRNQYRIKYYSILAGNDSNKLKKELDTLERLIQKINI